MEEVTIRQEDLNEDQRELAELIGLENFKLLVQYYGGLQIYIPKADNFCRKARNERIRAEFTGGNVKALAAKYALTEIQIRTIVNSLPREKKKGQESPLFGLGPQKMYH